MTLPIINLVIGITALILALAALVRAGGSGGKAVAAGAAAKQKHSPGRADLSVALVKHPAATGSGKVALDFRFWITNESNVTALNVILEVDLDEQVLFQEEVSEKLPYPELPPGESFELCSRITLKTPREFSCTVYWQNPNGTQDSQAFALDRTAG